jgi:ferritin-like metal-binding protein YciE
MLMKIQNLTELLADNLKKLYSSEEQQLKALSEIAARANSRSLKTMIHAYAAIKEMNLSRLKTSLKLMEETERFHSCKVVAGLITDCQETMDHAAEEHVADAGLIGTLQQINHFNIANYGTVSSYARTLKIEDVAQMVHKALEDEKKADELLTRLAEKVVNPSAILDLQPA